MTMSVSYEECNVGLTFQNQNEHGITLLFLKKTFA